MIKVKIEKLCKSDSSKDNSWILSHTRFCRIGDIVRINDIKEKMYKVISGPMWDTASKDWDLKLESYYES